MAARATPRSGRDQTDSYSSIDGGTQGPRPASFHGGSRSPATSPPRTLTRTPIFEIEAWLSSVPPGPPGSGGTLRVHVWWVSLRRRPDQPASDGADDIYDRLLRERIIFLGTQIDDSTANLVCGQLLVLAAEDAGKDIRLYINSPGGSIDAGLAIYDTMQLVPCDVATTCMGLAASMGQFLLCAGTRGKRFALPHARILMHQPLGQMQGRAVDIAIQAEQIIYLKRLLIERIAFHTGQPIEQIEADSDRDRWFSAQEAKDYGFIDAVVERTTTVSEAAPD